MIWLVNFQENKNIKNTEAFCLSILTLHKWFDHLNFDMFTAVTLTRLAEDGESRLAWLLVIRNFLANDIYLFPTLSH